MRRAWGTCVLTFAMAANLIAEKQYKSDAEYKIYSEATAAFGANDAGKALAALETWKQKFPESDYAPERAQLFVQAYARGGQPVQAVEAARAALAGPFATSDDRLRLLYTVTTAVMQMPSPPAEIRGVAQDAAEKLLAFDKKPAAMKPEEWDKALEGLRGAARVALVHLALTPVREALKTGECASVEADAVKSVEQFPETVQASWVLGQTRLCAAMKDESKFPAAIYSLARAAALDPARGLVDPAWQKSAVVPYFEKMFTKYHGKDAEGMKSLRELALTSPLPPQGFTLESATQIEKRKQADLEARHPELALWLKVRAALAAPNGPAYFESDLKDVVIPKLAGTVVEAKPACRPRELRVAMTEGSAPEVVLVFSRPLTGRVQPSAIQFDASPTAFSPEPYLLTMAAEPARLGGLKTTPCTAAAR